MDRIQAVKMSFEAAGCRTVTAEELKQIQEEDPREFDAVAVLCAQALGVTLDLADPEPSQEGGFESGLKHVSNPADSATYDRT